MTRLILATRNAHKVDEIRQILGDGFDVGDLGAIGEAPLVEETGATFEQNASLKALAISKCTGELVLADDSGLAVDALDGAPGVYSARYAGVAATDMENCAKLLTALATERTARFICVLALAQKGKLLEFFTGTIEGAIATAPRGTHGFGYDPIFIPKGHSATFAELGTEAKNRLSHRSEALQKLRTYFATTAI